MPPVSTQSVLSPFATADLSKDTVVIEGRVFRVQKLQSASFKDTEMQEAARKKKSSSLSAYVKELPVEVRRAYKLGKKVESFKSQGLAERKVASELQQKKQDAFRKATGIKYVNQWIRRKHKDQLEVTSAEIACELDRLRTIVAAVERGFEES